MLGKRMIYKKGLEPDPIAIGDIFFCEEIFPILYLLLPLYMGPFTLQRVCYPTVRNKVHTNEIVYERISLHQPLFNPLNTRLHDRPDDVNQIKTSLRLFRISLRCHTFQNRKEIENRT